MRPLFPVFLLTRCALKEYPRMVSLRAVDALIRATLLRRAVAFQLALWIAAVLIYAIYAAYRDSKKGDKFISDPYFVGV